MIDLNKVPAGADMNNYFRQQTEKDAAKYNFSQQRSDYLTPPELLNVIFDFMSFHNIKHDRRFGLDTCCSQNNIPANYHYIDGENDGLTLAWRHLSYCNPPYKYCDKWVKKAYAEMQKGITSVLLIPARTETKYFQEYILFNGEDNRKGVYIKFLRKGYKFLNPDTHEPMGVFKNPLAIVIMDGSQYA